MKGISVCVQVIQYSGASEKGGGGGGAGGAVATGARTPHSQIPAGSYVYKLLCMCLNFNEWVQFKLQNMPPLCTAFHLLCP